MLAKVHVVACQVISRSLDLTAATDEEVVKMTAPICPTAIIAFFGIFGQFAVAFTAQHTIHHRPTARGGYLAWRLAKSYQPD